MNNNYIGVDLDLFRQPKIQRLEVKHGKGAVAIYLQIYLKLAELGGKINLDDLELWEREFFVKKETLESVIYFPDLFTIKDNFLYSDCVNKKLNRIKTKSEKARESANARWSKIRSSIDNSSNANALPTHNERNANKENKIKENKIKKEYKESVFLSEEEFVKLSNEFGEIKTNQLLEKLSNFKIANGKKYKSDYHAILNWVVDAVAKDTRTKTTIEPNSTFYNLTEPAMKEKFKNAKIRI